MRTEEGRGLALQKPTSAAGRGAHRAVTGGEGGTGCACPAASTLSCPMTWLRSANWIQAVLCAFVALATILLTADFAVAGAAEPTVHHEGCANPSPGPAPACSITCRMFCASLLPQQAPAPAQVGELAYIDFVPFSEPVDGLSSKPEPPPPRSASG